MASTLVCSIWPLLPVSMMATPSIMMVLFCVPPLPSRVVPTTPGVSAVERRPVAAGDRQVLDRLGAHRERPLAALRLNHRGLAGDGDRFGRAADFDRQGADATRSPGLTCDVRAARAS